MKKSIIFSILAICGMLFSLNVSAQNSRQYIREQIQKWGECKNVAITEYNGDLALYGRNGWAGIGLPRELSNTLDELNEKNELIDDVQITEKGNWLVLYGDNGFHWSGIPYSLEKEIREYNRRNDVVTSVTFNDDGDWIIISRQYYTASSQGIQDWLVEGAEKYGQLWAACITSDAIVACYEEGYKYFGNVPQGLKDALSKSSLNVYRIKIAGTAWFYSDEDGNYNYHM